MGLWKNPGWADADDRRKVLDDYVDQADITQFGLARMPTGEKEMAVTAHFNRVALKYDVMNSLLSFGIHHAWKRTAVRMLRLQPGDRVLDVCGGTGDLSVLAARRVGPGGHIMLYDINRRMMHVGQNRDENRRFSDRIHYVQGNAEYISFPEARFDAAMVGFGIRNVTHPREGLREMARTLKPGGSLLCLDFSKPVNALFRCLYDFYSFNVMPLVGRLLTGSDEAYARLSETIRFFATPEELKAIFEEIGLRDIGYRRMTNGIAVAVLGRKPG